MDDRWETEVMEYSAINITGFRIVDNTRRYVKEFLDGWKRLDPAMSAGAGKESISVCHNIIHTAVAIQSMRMHACLSVKLRRSHITYSYTSYDKYNSTEN